MVSLDNNQNFKRLLFLRYEDDLIIGVQYRTSKNKNKNKQPLLPLCPCAFIAKAKVYLKSKGFFKLNRR
jgi:hypothetical protein